jgi:hypothetical protein
MGIVDDIAYREQKVQEQRAAEELMKELIARLEGRKPDEVAAMAHLASVTNTAAIQALIELLLQKGIISQRDLSGALRYHYNKATDMLRHGRDQSIITPQAAPVAKPI